MGRRLAYLGIPSTPWNVSEFLLKNSTVYFIYQKCCRYPRPEKQSQLKSQMVTKYSSRAPAEPLWRITVVDQLQWHRLQSSAVIPKTDRSAMLLKASSPLIVNSGNTETATLEGGAQATRWLNQSPENESNSSNKYTHHTTVCPMRIEKQCVESNS